MLDRKERRPTRAIKKLLVLRLPTFHAVGLWSLFGRRSSPFRQALRKSRARLLLISLRRSAILSAGRSRLPITPKGRGQAVRAPLYYLLPIDQKKIRLRRNRIELSKIEPLAKKKTGQALQRIGAEGRRVWFEYVTVPPAEGLRATS